LVNMPTRAVKGSAWDGTEQCWRHNHHHYAAIYFHDDDLHNVAWETDFSWQVPPDFRSGVYGVRLTATIIKEDVSSSSSSSIEEEVEDIIPFYVRPPRGRKPKCDIVFLAPTFTYQIYANHVRGNATQEYYQRASDWGARTWHPDEFHPEYGQSTYNFHSDGASGVCYSSRLRPMLTFRPGFLTFCDPWAGSGLRHFSADTHLTDWLETMGYAFDVVTDEDLHTEGVDLLNSYRVVLTGSHPEYHTLETLTALQSYTAGGGRLMYLGGNGFYWRIACHQKVPGLLEIRRAEGGIRAWAAEPGEYYHALDGEYGGLWRRNGRPPQQLVGVGFSSQGRFQGSYYVRTKASYDDKRVSWMFQGMEDEEIFGDFGLSGGGAAGFELDRADHKLGTPLNCIVVARSEDHDQRTFVPVHEELLTHVSTITGLVPSELIHADIVIFPSTEDGEGGVFSTGSITFCGSLSHDNYNNNISKLMVNVLNRFRSEKPVIDIPSSKP
jgi:N,N-dimethylformamidase